MLTRAEAMGSGSHVGVLLTLGQSRLLLWAFLPHLVPPNPCANRHTGWFGSLPPPRTRTLEPDPGPPYPPAPHPSVRLTWGQNVSYTSSTGAALQPTAPHRGGQAWLLV